MLDMGRDRVSHAIEPQTTNYYLSHGCMSKIDPILDICGRNLQLHRPIAHCFAQLLLRQRMRVNLLWNRHEVLQQSFVVLWFCSFPSRIGWEGEYRSSTSVPASSQHHQPFLEERH